MSTKIQEAKAKAEELRKSLAKIDALTGKDNERTRDTERKRGKRSKNKEVQVPPCADPERRALLESDDAEWLRYYFDDPETGFWYPFTLQQLAMIEGIRKAIIFGGDQALAASRGEGKTKICERLLLKYTLQGLIKFSVLFAATATAAEDSLQAMRDAVEHNEKLLLDYPEVCVPVRALEDTPNRAHYQVCTGKRHDNGEPYEKISSRFTWCGKEIVLPNVPGSPAARGTIATRGLDSAVRGLNKKDRRPQVAVIDDPDTDETINSPEQAKKLERRIDRGIAGLGGQQRGVARIILTTLQSPDCVSAWFTDPGKKPSFHGRRFRFLLKRPTHEDKWDEYVMMRQQDFREVDAAGNPTDEFARHAHAFYLENKSVMDAGAEVANLNRYDGRLLDDGSQMEVSALQRYFNEVARIGPDAVSAEYDNDPPAEAGPVESGITPHRIQRQLSGYERKVIPSGCTLLTCGVDVRKIALHWVVRAWMPDGTGYTIDYGVHEVLGTQIGDDNIGVDRAILRAVLACIEERKAAGYMKADGELLPIALMLVDAGWKTDAVKTACKQAGLGVYPVMGFGKSSGCAQANFSPAQKQTPTCKPGDGWKLVRKEKVWLVEADADRWKTWEHDRWLTAPGKPGCMYIFGQPNEHPERLSDDEKRHHSYARHICNEVEIEEPHKGTIRRRFKAKSDNTHYLDASYYSDVAASIKGIRVLRPQQPVAAVKPKPNRRKVEYL